MNRMDATQTAQLQDVLEYLTVAEKACDTIDDIRVWVARAVTQLAAFVVVNGWIED